VLFDEPTKVRDLVDRKAPVGREANWIKPELGQIAVAPYVNMRRLVILKTIEEKHIRSDSENDRHVAMLILG
jgi:hypothetical protein